MREKYFEKLNRIKVIFLLTILVLFIVGFSLFGIGYLNKSKTYVYKYQIIAIATNSMVPTFERGDAIIFEKVDVHDIMVGQVLVFQSDRKIITHRVEEIVNSDNKVYFYTKGDANNARDSGIIEGDNVLGVGKTIVKFIGYPTVIINELFDKGGN